MTEQDIQYQAEAFLNANKKSISFKEWADSKDFQKSDKEKIIEVLTHNSAPESEVMKKEEHKPRPLDENVSKICNICCKSVPLSIIVEYREFGSKDPDDFFWTTCCRKCYNQGKHHV